MEILNMIVGVVISLTVILLIVGIILGIVFAVLYANEDDKEKKKRNFGIMLGCFFGPAGLLFLTLSVWGLISILTNTFAA